MQPRASMANSKPPTIQIPEDDEDVEFLCQLDAAEAQALSLSSSSKRRRIAVDTAAKSETQKPDFAGVIEEGAYTAALKGSKSLTWQKQQQSSLTRTPTQSIVTTTVGGGGGGGACFKCGKEGHWARDCPQTTSSGGNFGSPSMAVVGVEKACPCGLGICLLLTANTERNRGRKFFRCPNRQENGGCGFFEWCDESSEKITSPEVSADKAWRNGGQQQSYQRPTNQAASGPTRSWYEFDFDKGTTAPNASYGQKFEATENRSYGQKFEATENRSYGIRSGSSCFKCGQEGHWAKDCPSTTISNVAAGAVGSQRFEATDNKSYGTKSGSSCFKCGQEGHWARDCPTATSNVAPAAAIGNQSSGACYKCGQAGHWARDCSSQSQGQSTKLRSW